MEARIAKNSTTSFSDIPIWSARYIKLICCLWIFFSFSIFWQKMLVKKLKKKWTCYNAAETNMLSLTTLMKTNEKDVALKRENIDDEENPSELVNWIFENKKLAKEIPQQILERNQNNRFITFNKSWVVVRNFVASNRMISVKQYCSHFLAFSGPKTWWYKEKKRRFLVIIKMNQKMPIEPLMVNF